MADLAQAASLFPFLHHSHPPREQCPADQDGYEAQQSHERVPQVVIDPFGFFPSFHLHGCLLVRVLRSCADTDPVIVMTTIRGTSVFIFFLLYGLFILYSHSTRIPRILNLHTIESPIPDTEKAMIPKSIWPDHTYFHFDFPRVVSYVVL